MTRPADKLDLARLRALLATATPGPWGRTTSGDPHWLREVRDPTGFGVAWCGSTERQAHADATLIAALRNAAPELLRRADEWEEMREALQAVLDAFPETFRGTVIEADAATDAVCTASALLDRIAKREGGDRG